MQITFPGALLLLFITLKLCGVIAWSWWWVTSPVWGSMLLSLVISLILEIRLACETPEQKAARLLRELAERMGRQ